jgi:transcription initiation factor TFIID subunit 2/histone acetyltransferase MYST3
MNWCLFFVAFLSEAFTASISLKTITITDGEYLKEYLCSPSNTIPPYTQLLIIHPGLMRLNNAGITCLVENTTNIHISSQEQVVVSCHNSGSGFGFFNVTHLTIELVQFSDCEWGVIPREVVKYINESNQFFYYTEGAQTALLFSHCYHLELYNVRCTDLKRKYNHFGIIGVNSCGGDITSDIRQEDLLINTMLFYYTDSAIMLPNSECNLHIETFILSAAWTYIEIDEELSSGIERMNIRSIRDFALYIAQQDFKVDVDITFRPMSDFGFASGMSAIIMFVNSVSDSHVTINGHQYPEYLGSPYETCDSYVTPQGYRDPENHKPLDGSCTSLQLDVIFYESPSFNGSAVRNSRMTTVMIRNILFRRIDNEFHHINGRDTLSVLQFTHKLSYQVEIKEVVWFYNSITNTKLLHAQSFSKNSKKVLHLNMTDVSAHRYQPDRDPWQPDPASLMLLVNMVCTISGNSSLRQNFGGSVISAVSSNLTITGNLTVSDGRAFQGGGIRLDTASYLFLKEPLNAHFINNSAQKGSAIYAPLHVHSLGVSTIQIVPSNTYSLGNLSNIKIQVHFNRTEFGYSLYAPRLKGYFVPPNILFEHQYWDSRRCQYAYTSLIDTIFIGEDVDKYTSLDNGFCFMMSGKETSCIYLDMFNHRPPDFTQPKVDVYPGANSLSLACADNKQYLLEYEYNSQEIPCKAEDYGLWRTSVSSDNYVVLKFLSSNLTHSFNLALLHSANNVRAVNNVLKVMVLKKCPVGFSINQMENGYCRCASLLQEHDFECDIDALTIVSSPNYWSDISHGDGDNSSDHVLFNMHCPPNYCSNFSTGFRMHLNDTLISGTICANNRSGILCGQCVKNYSAVFGSDVCYSHCSDLYLLTLLVYALAGILLVVALFVLRLTVATGTINGMIFYANVLDLSMNTFSSENTRYDLTPFRIIISLLNLNIGFPVCLYEGMTPTSKAGLQFVFPVYLWSIVLGLIVASRYSVRLANTISHSSVQVLATLFYLSFSKIISSAIYILSVSTVFSVRGYGLDPEDYSNATTLVWYYGGTDYGKGEHGLLLSVAVAFVVLFLLPYTVLVTFSYCLVSFKTFNRFRPFIDAYGGPFKDKCRFWFGLRLWLTALLLSLNGALQGTDTKEMLIAHFVIMQAFILLQGHLRPFRSHLVGTLDMFFMLNYLLIVVFYLQLSQSDFLVAYVILVSLAISVMVLILLSHLLYNYIYLKKQAVFRDWKIKISNRLKKYQAIESENESSDDDLFHAAKERELPDTYGM